MSETQTLEQENIDANKIINFAPAKMKLFKDEFDKQLEEDNGIDILKAIGNGCHLDILLPTTPNYFQEV